MDLRISTMAAYYLEQKQSYASPSSEVDAGPPPPPPRERRRKPTNGFLQRQLSP